MTFPFSLSIPFVSEPFPSQTKSISKTLAVNSQNSFIEWLLPVAKIKSSGYFAEIILNIPST